MTPKEFSIYIKNNTSDSANIQLFNTVYQAFINGDVTFTWDITDELYNNKDRVSMSYTSLDGSGQKTIVVEGSFTTPQSVVQALNSMGIGFFYLVEVGGVVLIKTDTILYVYGELDIYRSVNIPPSFVDFGIPITYRIQNTASIKIAGWVTDANGDTLTISSLNLPSFCVLSQYDYANARVFNISVSPSGGNNGSYSFSLTASNGIVSTTKTFNLVVANPASVTNFAPMVYPISPDPLVRSNGDTTSESYSRTGVGSFSFSSSRSQGIPASAFSGGVLSSSVILFPGYSSPEVVGEGLIAIVFGTSGSPTLALVQDTFIVRIEIT